MTRRSRNLAQAEVAASVSRGHLLLVRRDLEQIDGDLSFLPDIAGLISVSLVGVGLSSFPEPILRLTKLRQLDLTGNYIEDLPEDIGDLQSLQILRVARNGISWLPESLGLLSNLEELDVSENGIWTYPESLVQLTKLSDLDISGNPPDVIPIDLLVALPALRRLGLMRLGLTSLPAELGRLSDQVALDLDDNPLEQPLSDLVRRGSAAVLAYLRSSIVDGRARYEGKLIVVGEGDVGKTSLVAAIQGEPFVENRETTHGIEIHTIRLPNTETGDQSLSLRAWDFGGQEIYRVTHQFFFSRRSLYLVVWDARDGAEHDQVLGWLKRIQLRVGADCRIVIVATHGDMRQPEIDLPELQRQFGEALLEHRTVDNESLLGIDELRETLALAASRLPQMGEIVSDRWIGVRDKLEESESPQITRTEFDRICDDWDLPADEADALANLLHDLGFVLYFSEDDGLRDIIVLKPDWLTKAIDIVLEDEETRSNGGELSHGRVSRLWLESGYPSKYHPYFLRLMEKFEVSYRIPGEDNSLVAQLVSKVTPTFEWTFSGTGTSSLTFECKMSDSPPGLIPWLTVRTHRMSTGAHWARGLFVRHSGFESEALLELLEPTTLRVQVRASYPTYLFAVLRDTLEDVIGKRWPGLTYDLLVPCSVAQQGEVCPGRFKLKTLEKFRHKHSVIACHECTEENSIDLLLTGLVPEMRPLDERLAEVVQSLERLEGGIGRAAAEVRTIRRALGQEVTDCPRLFSMYAANRRRIDPRRIYSVRYRIQLWCEHPGTEHPAGAAYEVSADRAWLERVAPYLRVMVLLLQIATPVVLPAADLGGSRETVLKELDLMKGLGEALGAATDRDFEFTPDAAASALSGRAMNVAAGAGLRAFREQLLTIDPAGHYGSLRRVLDETGEYLWVCESHHSVYDPGLPQMDLSRQ